MPHPEDATYSGSSAPLVLVVDDEQASRSTISRMIRGMGYQGRSCRSGREALRFLATNPRAVRLLIAVYPPSMGPPRPRAGRRSSGQHEV